MARRTDESATMASMRGLDGEPGDEPDRVSGGTAVAPVETVNATVVSRGGMGLQTLTEWLFAKVSEGGEDTFEAIERIVMQVMTSKTPDQVLANEMPLSGKTFTDKPFLIHGFTVTKSSFEEGDGCPFYANLDVTLPGNDMHRVVNVGSWKVLAQVMALDLMDSWPQLAMLKAKDRPTAKGFYPLTLERPK